MDGREERWRISKAVVRSPRGVVAAQHAEAAEIGAAVLRDGGNAVDAAVATALALGVLEPWMSGIGGGGYMTVYRAAEGRSKIVNFSMVAPAGLDPSDYPLSGGGTDADLFGWPAVKEDRNVKGPLSIAVPGSVDGLAVALERFGSLPWRTVLEPAIGLAKEGHPVTWWTTLKVAGEAHDLIENQTASRVYLPGGLPPRVPESGRGRLDLGALAGSLEQLARAGHRDFYEGALAAALADDLAAAGSRVTAADLAAYRAVVQDPLLVRRGDAEIHLPPGLNAGPSFAAALDALPPVAAGAPDAETYAAYAEALSGAYAERLETMGHDGDASGRGSTTHLSVIDGAGNMVALTNTLLSLFGSKVLLPSSGVLMNNGVMWFDPQPGRPNSIAPGVAPLSNMVPLAVTRDGAPWFALGASGGRRILPAVFQLTSFLIDGRLSLEQAVATPRLNVDGGAKVQVDRRLPQAVFDAVEARRPAEWAEAKVSPNYFANPQIVMRDGTDCLGVAETRLPVADARPA